MQRNDAAAGTVWMTVGQRPAEHIVFINAMRKAAGKQHIYNGEGFIKLKVCNILLLQSMLGQQLLQRGNCSTRTYQGIAAASCAAQHSGLRL